MPAKILLVDNDLATLNWLKAKFESEGYSVVTARFGREAIPQIETGAPDVVVIDPVLPDLDGLEILRRARKDVHNKPPWLIIFSKKYQSQDIAAGYEAGADDYIWKRFGADAELVGKIRGHLSQTRKPIAMPAPTPGAGHIFAFCSPKGGTGTTSVCINLAHALAQLQPDARILVVDMVFPLGTVASSLNYESKRTVARLSNETTEALDRSSVEKYISAQLSWGFRVLIGANDPQDAASIEVSRVMPLFDALRKGYDYVFVDFGRTLSRISLPIIEVSDKIVTIVTPEIATIKSAKLMLNFFAARNIVLERIYLVNNRTVGRVWTTNEDIERELGIKVRATIPYVVEYMTMAINESVPFMRKFPDHATSAMFRQVAEQLRDQVKV